MKSEAAEGARERGRWIGLRGNRRWGCGERASTPAVRADKIVPISEGGALAMRMRADVRDRRSPDVARRQKGARGILCHRPSFVLRKDCVEEEVQGDDGNNAQGKEREKKSCISIVASWAQNESKRKTEKSSPRLRLEDHKNAHAKKRPSRKRRRREKKRPRVERKRNRVDEAGRMAHPTDYLVDDRITLLAAANDFQGCPGKSSEILGIETRESQKKNLGGVERDMKNKGKRPEEKTGFERWYERQHMPQVVDVRRTRIAERVLKKTQDVLCVDHHPG
ncbi:hypothetical protein B0H19DRAFT_1083224 [Mycena capillaripes]|nr:hypothetical protein B0H19DRAFT_1083224 [Mycena capillaripes]